MRPTGIEIIGEVPWGTHFCQFYQDKQDLVDILVPYFKAGLEQNEFCMWVTSEPLQAEEAKAALAREVADLDEYVRQGQIAILDYSEWYTLGGRFDTERVLRGWVDKLDAARKRGFDGLRLTGNTFWLEKADWQDFTEYEAAVDSVLGQYRMLAMCTYSLTKCGAVEIMDVVSNHAFALIKRGGKWQIIESEERRKIEASLRQSEERYRSLFNGMTEGFALHEIVCDETGKPCDYRFLEVNPAFERLTGLKRSDVVGQCKTHVLPNDDPYWTEIYGTVALTGKSVHFENYSPALRRHYEVFAYCPAPRQFAVLFVDITERKQTQAELQRARDELEQKVRDRTADLAATVGHLEAEVRQRQAAEADLQRVNQLMRVVSDCNQALVRIEDERALIQEICRLMLEVDGYRMAWVGYAENDAAKSVRVAGYVGFAEGYLEHADVTWADTERGQGPTGSAIRLGQVRIGRDFLVDPELAPWRDLALERGFQSSIALPLSTGGKVFGALTIYASQPAAFGASQVKVLVELADDLAFGIMALRTRAALQESRQHLQQVVHNAPVLIWATDPQGVYTLAEGNLQSLGLTAEKVVGRHMSEIVGDRQDILEHFERARNGEPMAVEVEYGGMIFESRYSQLRDADGRISGVMCVSTDITERRRTEHEVLAATEQERRRIGRDLHDSIQASLAGVGFLLGALRQRLGEARGAAAAEVEEIARIVKEIIDQTRGLARGLCPLELESHGLMTALRLLASTMSSLFRIPCELRCEKTVLVHDETIASQLYYICQEAVSNAVKHGHPACVQIRITGEGDYLCLQVQDDGVGMPQDVAAAKGMGLRTMTYRARVVGAHLEIRRGDPRGTLVACSLRAPCIEVAGRQLQSV